MNIDKARSYNQPCSIDNLIGFEVVQFSDGLNTAIFDPDVTLIGCLPDPSTICPFLIIKSNMVVLLSLNTVLTVRLEAIAFVALF